ncbi:hypothetical protein [Streptomyces sp. SCUT-3]|uniref:hypothetical protein n=1 Tax=Streptomyces sp. SCUT-3 TaxID=2684469 RepID=UPI0031FBB944
MTATGATAQAGTLGAQGTYAGCPSGYVCIYQGASWNNGVTEHKYYTYGAHNLVNEYGTHRVFNNQTGDATVQLCRGYNGVDCGSKIKPWTYVDVDLTPYNSIKLSP